MTPSAATPTTRPRPMKPSMIQLNVSAPSGWPRAFVRAPLGLDPVREERRLDPPRSARASAPSRRQASGRWAALGVPSIAPKRLLRGRDAHHSFRDHVLEHADDGEPNLLPGLRVTDVDGHRRSGRPRPKARELEVGQVTWPKVAPRRDERVDDRQVRPRAERSARPASWSGSRLQAPTGRRSCARRRRRRVRQRGTARTCARYVASAASSGSTDCAAMTPHRRRRARDVHLRLAHGRRRRGHRADVEAAAERVGVVPGVHERDGHDRPDDEREHYEREHRHATPVRNRLRSG